MIGVMCALAFILLIAGFLILLITAGVIRDMSPETLKKNIRIFRILRSSAFGMMISSVLLFSLLIFGGGNGASSNGNKVKSETCPSCNRIYTTHDEKHSIARTGMCQNCYSNYEVMSQFIGK